MKKPVGMFVVSLLSALALTLSCSTPPPQLQAGAAAVDITPKVWPVPLIGSFSFRPAEKAHDPLHVRAIALDDGATQLAIAVVDSCYVHRDVLDDAKQRASERTGIPTSNMLVSATHTHSAPSVRDYCLGSRADAAYRSYLPGKIAEAEGPVDRHRILGVRAPDRQPLRIGLRRGLLAGLPVALLVRLVILRLVGGGVVGGFVVVPDGDQRVPRGHRLKIGVAAVLGVANAVVLQRDELVGGFRHAAQLFGGFLQLFNEGFGLFFELFL